MQEKSGKAQANSSRSALIIIKYAPQSLWKLQSFFSGFCILLHQSPAYRLKQTSVPSYPEKYKFRTRDNVRLCPMRAKGKNNETCEFLQKNKQSRPWRHLGVGPYIASNRTYKYSRTTTHSPNKFQPLFSIHPISNSRPKPRHLNFFGNLRDFLGHF